MLTTELVNECVRELTDARDRLQNLTNAVVDRLQTELSQRGIMLRVNGRIKQPESLKNKLLKWKDDPEKVERISTSREVFEAVSDLAAVRVLTYTESDRHEVAKLVPQLFRSRPGHTDCEMEKKEDSPRIKDSPHNFYRATHFQVMLPEALLVYPLDNLINDHCELQVSSILAHVWNEIEHDLVYKLASSPINPVEKNALDALGHLTKSGDDIVESMMTSYHQRTRSETSEELVAAESFDTQDQLAALLTKSLGPKCLWGQETDFYENTEALFMCLKYLRITTLGGILCQFVPQRLKAARELARKVDNHWKPLSKLQYDPGSCDLFTVCLIQNHPGRWVGFKHQDPENPVNGNKRAMRFIDDIMELTGQ